MQFSFSRFLLLLRKQFAEHGRLYGLGLAAWLVYGPFCWCSSCIRMAPGSYAEHLLLALCLTTGGVVFAQHLFQPLANAPDAIRYLHLPASSLEKVAAALFLCLFVFLPVVLVAFLCGGLPHRHLGAAAFCGASGRAGTDEGAAVVQSNHSPAGVNALVTAVSAFGSVYFRR